MPGLELVKTSLPASGHVVGNSPEVLSEAISGLDEMLVDARPDLLFGLRPFRLQVLLAALVVLVFPTPELIEDPVEAGPELPFGVSHRRLGTLGEVLRRTKAGVFGGEEFGGQPLRSPLGIDQGPTRYIGHCDDPIVQPPVRFGLDDGDELFGPARVQQGARLWTVGEAGQSCTGVESERRSGPLPEAVKEDSGAARMAVERDEGVLRILEKICKAPASVEVRPAVPNQDEWHTPVGRLFQSDGGLLLQCTVRTDPNDQVCGPGFGQRDRSILGPVECADPWRVDDQDVRTPGKRR